MEINGNSTKKYDNNDDDRIRDRAIIEEGVLKVFFNEELKIVNLNEYEDISVLACGTNAVTILGTHKKMKRLECIKIYTPNTSAKRKQVSMEQYLREIRKLATLNDPRFVTEYNAYDIEGNIHVVTMEYVKGCTLKEWLNRRNDRDDEQDHIDRIMMAKNLLEAILFYEEKGIIHGDLHQNNILVDDENQIHIIDFGTSYFAKMGQSEQRESFFVYDLVRSVLGKWFEKKYFTVICPKRCRAKLKHSFLYNISG